MKKYYVELYDCESDEIIDCADADTIDEARKFARQFIVELSCGRSIRIIKSE